MLNLKEKFSEFINIGNLKVRPSNREWIEKKARLLGMCYKQFVRFTMEEAQRIDEAKEHEKK